MMTWPLPSDDAAPVAEPESVTLGPGEQATITYEPELSDATFVLPTLAVSKRPASSYEVVLDDEIVWGPAAFPPTDIDDMETVWIPSREFTDQLRVQITNLEADGAERDYYVLPVGFEE
jgi:hypothetical protein